MPLSEIKFIVDDMAGRLARWLRIAGFDTFYQKSIPDGELIGRALREGRVILSRDTRLVRSRTLPNHLLIRSPFLEEQLRQIFAELGLRLKEDRIFTRCIDCNFLLEEVTKESVRGAVPPYVYHTQEDFSRCPSCGKIFWKGTHWERVVAKLRSVVEKINRSKHNK